ncbi:MAG: DUF6379 domain-containing protein [Eubacteriales bacterium]|nr:DUF6379 domain-containing protein [Eubacteriales bacterium]
MLEADMIQTRGFHNILENGKIVGFQFCIRLTYYRGIFLSQLRPQKVVVDGGIFPKELVTWNIKGIDFTVDEMVNNAEIQWCSTETATLKIYKPGGLTQGYHEISTGYKYSSSYMPPELQKSIDSEETDPFLEMMFGQLHSTRKLLLVW